MNAHVSPVSLLDAARALFLRRQARSRLIEWVRAVGYEPAPHHVLLINLLERLARGETRRAMIFMPPGSAKSTYTSVLMPAWYLAQPGAGNVIAASHSTELAERFGRKVRGLVQEHERTLGYGVSPESHSAGRWSTSTGREYYATGAGTGIAGFRSSLSIVDDPIRTRQDADSKLIRDRIWQWYNDDLDTRLVPGGSVALVMTRYHEDDLAGRLLDRMARGGEEWEVLSLPAIAMGEDDPLGRKAGQWLWEGDYGYADRLREVKRDADPRSWSALYQQQPTPESGDYFKREWLHSVDVLPARTAMRVYGASDYAVTAKGGDYTVHLVLGLDPDNRLYILDLWRGQTDSAEWIEAWCDLVIKWRPSEWGEERGQILASIGPFLERRAIERKAYTYRRQFPSRDDKSVRAQSIRARMSMLGLYLPANAAWRGEFEGEVLRFPAAVHDDQCVIEGTLIAMADGSDRPIETVTAGDLVATPVGPRRVLASGVTNDAADVFEVRLSDGGSLKSTANHPVFVQGKGFVRVDALRYSDPVVLWGDECSAEQLRLRFSSTGETDTGGIRTVSIGTMPDTSMRLSLGAGSFIGICGKMNTVQSLLDTTFTIATTIGATIASIISSACQRLNIGGGILPGLSGSESIWRARVLKLRSGTVPQMGLHGISSTGRRPGKGATLLRLLARAVAKRLMPTSGGQSIAQHRAVYVTAVEALPGRVRVRNLTVQDAHVYYANRVLTHNCDALSLAGQLLDHMQVPLRPKADDTAKPAIGFTRNRGNHSPASFKVY